MSRLGRVIWEDTKNVLLVTLLTVLLAAAQAGASP